MSLNVEHHTGDAAFDAGLVSFSDPGQALASPKLGAQARARLALSPVGGD